MPGPKVLSKKLRVEVWKRSPKEFESAVNMSNIYFEQFLSLYWPIESEPLVAAC